MSSGECLGRYAPSASWHNSATVQGHTFESWMRLRIYCRHSIGGSRKTAFGFTQRMSVAAHLAGCSMRQRLSASESTPNGKQRWNGSVAWQK